jgi:hypothetical protein
MVGAALILAIAISSSVDGADYKKSGSMDGDVYTDRLDFDVVAAQIRPDSQPQRPTLRPNDPRGNQERLREYERQMDAWCVRNGPRLSCQFRF